MVRRRGSSGPKEYPRKRDLMLFWRSAGPAKNGGGGAGPANWHMISRWPGPMTKWRRDAGRVKYQRVSRYPGPMKKWRRDAGPGKYKRVSRLPGPITNWEIIKAVTNKHGFFFFWEIIKAVTNKHGKVWDRKRSAFFFPKKNFLAHFFFLYRVPLGFKKKNRAPGGHALEDPYCGRIWVKLKGRG